MMSQKAALFHDAVTNTKILRANTPPDEWSGENLPGKPLMEVRAELAEK